MNNKVQNVNFLPDKYKTKLTPEDIFDRIINVKIVTGKQGTEEANEDLLEHQWLHIKVAGMAAKLLDTGNLPHRRGQG